MRAGGDGSAALNESWAAAAPLLMLRFDAVELALNLIDGCGRHCYDADLELFLDVISNRVPAEAHSAQMLMIDQLRNAFAVADRQSSSEGRITGFISKSSIGGVVRTVFPYQQDGDLRGLLTALDKDFAGGGDTKVGYVKLFEEDANLNQSPFVEKARGMCLRAPREYVNMIEATMKENDLAGTGMVSWKAALEAIAYTDPCITPQACEGLVKIGFGAESAEHEPRLPSGLNREQATVDMRVFCRRVLFSYPRRHGPAPKPINKSPEASPVGKRKGGRSKSVASVV